jgi:hypothetical protein
MSDAPSKESLSDSSDSPDFHTLYRLGKHHIGYQQSPDVFPDSLASYEVYGSLENGMNSYPEVPKDKWLKFDFSAEQEPIENPEFMD